MPKVQIAQGADSTYRPTVTFASGASVSGAVRTNGARGMAVVLPEAWTAADIGIDVSLARNDSEIGADTWCPLQGADGARVKITDIDTSNDPRPLRLFPAEAWAAGAFTYIRLVSINTSTEAAVNQAAARELTLVLLS